jgi:hypothetical protein
MRVYYNDNAKERHGSLSFLFCKAKTRAGVGKECRYSVPIVVAFKSASHGLRFILCWLFGVQLEWNCTLSYLYVDDMDMIYVHGWWAAQLTGPSSPVA